MRVETIVRVGVVTGLLLLLMPHGSWAQTAGSIAGVVRDTTGAVLPGVTVEASSPALIEKVRTVVTGGAGEYRILELRPGTYTVTFTLVGFNVLQREGIELTSGFTATVNAELPVGALEETVTVSGASPVVDVENVRVQNVLTRETLDALPTNRAVPALAALTIGVSVTTAGTGGSQDVGGNKGERYSGLTIHGSTDHDGRFLYDGMRYNAQGISGGGPSKHISVNQNDVQEMVIETAGMGADIDTAGVQVNVVPKSGGNTFRGNLAGTGLNHRFQADNLGDTLRARGLTTVSTLKRMYDIGGGLGGPILRDRLWFFTAHRWWGVQEYAPGNFYNKTQGTVFYTPDLTRQGFSDQDVRDNTLRLTAQIGQKHQVKVSHNNQHLCACQSGIDSGTAAPEAVPDYANAPLYLLQASWTYPATDRLLFQAGYTLMKDQYDALAQPETTADHIPYVDLTRNFTYNAQNRQLGIGGAMGIDYGQRNQRFSMSYITGSHTFKVGAVTLQGQRIQNELLANRNLTYNFTNPTGALPIPASITQWAGPGRSDSRVGMDMGLYAQDRWTLNRLTLNLGLRYDYFNGYVPAQVRPAGEYTPEFRFDRISDVPSFKDLGPRLGAAYDLFGNGKTAFKASVGRYVGTLGGFYPELVNPNWTISNRTTRIWNDVNGNYVPDCSLHNFAANGECGQIDNNGFGTLRVQNTYADDVMRGWDRREANWQTAMSVQHELWTGTAVNVGYFRGSYRNFVATDNTLVGPEDYDSYCITAPVDTRLPGGGGYQVCDLFDIKPAKFGQVNNVVTQSSHFGKQRRVFNGVDAAFASRFGAGGLLAGGMSTGHTVLRCVSPDLPTLQFCENDPPFSQMLQFKLAANYPLPWWGLQAATNLQNLKGTPLAASYTVTNAQIRPSLGRDLAACRGAAVCNATALIQLTEPNTLFEDRLTQVDVRLTKIVQFGRARLRGMFDVYNLFNANDALAVSTRYTPDNRWLRPASVLGARLFKVSGEIDF